MPTFNLDHIEALNAWLDRSNGGSPAEDVMRVFKLQEEAGEVAEAYIGMVGQNPRKGVTHTRADLLDELADMAITALNAIQHFTQNIEVTADLMETKLLALRMRAGV